MLDYRAYPIADCGRILGPPFALQAENDSEALRAACMSIDRQKLELWSGVRLVATLTPSPTSPESEWIVVLKS